MQRKLDDMEAKGFHHMIEIRKLQEDNKCLEQRLVELEVEIVELTSKLMVKDEEAAINDVVWNKEYDSLVVAINELKPLKRYEESLGNRISQILTNEPINLAGNGTS